MHINRILSGGDVAVYRDLMIHFDNQVAKDQELPAEKKQDLIRELITKVTDANGAIEVGNTQNGAPNPRTREKRDEGVCVSVGHELTGIDAEATHLLIQYLLADNFETTSTEYATLVKTVIQDIKVGAGKAAAAGRTSRVEAASRMYVLVYNQNTSIV